MKLNLNCEVTESVASANLALALDDTVKAAFALKISESELIDLLHARLRRRAADAEASQFASVHKMFHPEAGP